MRTRILSLVLVTAIGTVNMSWAQAPGIIDPVRPIAVQQYLCTLNTGKTMADLAEALQGRHAAAEASGYNGFSVQLTPRYASTPFDVIWLDLLPFDQVADTAQWWDDNAQEELASIFEVVSCQASLNASMLMYQSEAMLQDDDHAFLTWNWCTSLDGVSPEAHAAGRAAFVQRLSDANVRAAYSVMFPNFGVRTNNRLGDFAQIMVYPDWTALAGAHEYWATGGWRARAEYERTFAQCTGQNVYDVTVFNRPHTPWFE